MGAAGDGRCQGSDARKRVEVHEHPWIAKPGYGHPALISILFFISRLTCRMARLSIVALLYEFGRLWRLCCFLLQTR